MLAVPDRNFQATGRRLAVADIRVSILAAAVCYGLLLFVIHTLIDITIIHVIVLILLLISASL